MAAPEPWQLPGASEYDEIEYAGLFVMWCPIDADEWGSGQAVLDCQQGST
ncbi:hypothetical protein SRL2020226_61610 [Mycobacterium kiyosense]|nr:hypothetical protein SRL2020226_61610 [Mycobacterium kiyosense]